MRKVQVFKNVPLEKEAPYSGKWHVIEDGIAIFHQFGVDFEEFESGPANYTTAIIERQDGTIESILVTRIKFIDPLMPA